MCETHILGKLCVISHPPPRSRIKATGLISIFDDNTTNRARCGNCKTSQHCSKPNTRSLMDFDAIELLTYPKQNNILPCPVQTRVLSCVLHLHYYVYMRNFWIPCHDTIARLSCCSEYRESPNFIYVCKIYTRELYINCIK